MTKLQTCISMDDLKQRISTAAGNVDEDMLLCVWNKLDFRIDVGRVTKGSHIQQLTYAY
jgi:hypothetical protein